MDEEQWRRLIGEGDLLNGWEVWAEEEYFHMMMTRMPRKETLKEKTEVTEYTMPLFIHGWWMAMHTL